MRRALAAIFACAAFAAPASASASNGGVSVAHAQTRANGGVAFHVPRAQSETKRPPAKHRVSIPPPVVTTTTTTRTTSHSTPSTGGGGRADIPPAYRSLYASAGQSHGVDWRVLAAIGKIESDHGRSTAPGVQSGLNYARCCAGPMQICKASSCGNTWSRYAIDADGDGVASVYEPADAIFAAAAIVRDIESAVGLHPKLLLAAYNAGTGRVLHYKGVPPYPETKGYVTRGLKYMASLR